MYDLPSVPHGTVLHTQEPNWVRTSRTMNLSPRENHIPAWPSDSPRHLLISSHSVTFISLNYTWPCPIGYKAFPFYRWKTWGLKHKGDSWLEIGLQGEPIICVVSFKSSCFLLLLLLFFILMIKVTFIWKNSNISEIKHKIRAATIEGGLWTSEDGCLG